MKFQHVIYGIERTIHSREKRRVKNGWVTRYYPFRIGRWKVHQRSASCRRGKVNGGWIELDSGGGGEGEDGETMGWFEIPVGVSIEGMYPRFEANFSICLEKSRPWANAPNQYTRQANPPRVSPFPTGNTCKPRLYQPLRIPEGIADGGTPNSISPGTNYFPSLVLSLEGRGSGRKRLIEEKFRFRVGEGAVKRRARSIRNRITEGEGRGVARSWLNYRFGIEIKRRVRLFIFARSCNLRSGGEYWWPAGSRWYVTPRLFYYYRWFDRWFIYYRLIMERNL